MAQSRKKMRRLLEESLTDGVPVLVLRQQLDYFRTDAFVIGLTDTWVILQDLADSVHPDGIAMMRLDLLTEVEISHKADLILRAKQELGYVLPSFTTLADFEVADLLRIADEQTDMVLVRFETEEDEPLSIGKIRRIGKKRLDLQNISAPGRWDDEVERCRIDDITCIELGGRYLRTLERWGDPLPAATPERRN